MVRRASSLLGSIKEKGIELEKNDLIIYSSNFDYEKFEIADIKNELIKSEEKIFINLEKVGKATFEIAEELHQVNQKLANKKNGTYMAWCEAVGINKDRSSVLLKKYNLYLETNKKEAMKLPVRIIKALTKKDNNFTTDEIVTIVEAEIVGKIETVETKTINKEDLLAKKEKLFQENERLNKEIEEKFKIIEKNIDEMSDIDDMLIRIENR